MNGIAFIGSNSNGGAYKDVNIEFPAPFSGETNEKNIVVVATVDINMQYQDRFIVNIGNITQRGFTARVIRLDNDKGWGQTLYLDYIATTITFLATDESPVSTPM